MVELLRSLIPLFSHFQEHTIINPDGKILGFQSSLITSNNHPFSGGTATTLDKARRICAAESIERVFFNKLFKSPEELKNRFLIEEYPTSCGFAAGFDKNSTVFRAICESVERWAWSQWIDKENGLPQVHPRIDSDLSHYFINQFDNVIYFQIPLLLSNHLKPDFIGTQYVFSVSIGITESGIFPGSRVTTIHDNCWDHCLLEAWRHQIIYKNELKNSLPSNIFDQRIKYFGKNGVDKIGELIKFPIAEFPTARIRILEKVAQSDNGAANPFYVWRSLCEDFIGWDRGDDKRFVY